MRKGWLFVPELMASAFLQYLLLFALSRALLLAMGAEQVHYSREAVGDGGD